MEKADRWQKTIILRRYIEAAEAHGKENGISHDILQWLYWSKKKADWYDPFIEAEDECSKVSIELHLVSQNNNEGSVNTKRPSSFVWRATKTNCLTKQQ